MAGTMGSTGSSGKADAAAQQDAAHAEEPTAPKANTTIYFEGDEVEVAEPYRVLIKQSAERFNNKPAGMLIVSGHASSFDEPDEEVQLSLRRTRRVAKLLERYGVPSHQIVCVSRGANEPLVDPSDLERRWINRRVEVKEGSRVPRPPAWAQQRKKRKADAAAKEADREAALERMIERATALRAAARKAAPGKKEPTREAPAKPQAGAPAEGTGASGKPAAKKAAAEAPAAKKPAAKKPAAKKPAAKKPAAKKPAVKKPAAKKPAVKKPAAKKPAAKKPAAKKPAVKKPAVKKPAGNKAPAKKAAARTGRTRA